MKWSLICLSSIALVLTSCAHSDQTPAPSTVTPTNTMSSYESALKSLPDAIHSDGAFTECMVRATNMCISTTVLTQVRESRDLKLCDSLIDPGIKSSCRQTAVTLNAREKEDPSICDALGAGESTGCKQEVLTQKAVSSKKVDLCKEVMSLFTGSGADTVRPGDTESKADRAFDSCVIQIISSGSGNDPKVCDVMKSQIQKEMCKMILRERATIQGAPLVPNTTQPAEAKKEAPTTIQSTTTASSGATSTGKTNETDQ